MATWIVHLRLAENLLDMIDGIDPIHFVIGSITPDLGTPDEKWEKFDPPGELLHFYLQDSPLWRSADLEFYRQYLQDFPNEGENIDRFSFLLGYFFHLITDNFWDNKIDKPTRTKFSAEFEKDSQFVWEVKRDWYGLDFIYLRNNPKSIFYRIFLECSFNCRYLDFLPVEAVHQRIAYIREFYQRKDEKIQALFKRPYIYLS